MPLFGWGTTIAAFFLKLATFEGFEFVEGARPVGAEETGEAAVGEELAAGLAGGAVIGLVVGVSDALDLFAAARARLPVAAVDGHVLAEGGDFFGECRVRLRRGGGRSRVEVFRG